MSVDPEAWLLDELAHAGRENLDQAHAQRYDDKEDAGADDDVRLLEQRGLVTPSSTVIDLGAGTGQFTLAVARRCSRVTAVDVSPVMLERLRHNVSRSGLTNVECVLAGYLTYDHPDPPADLIYSRFALHHLPDFWKAVALSRMAGMLRAGGTLRLSDVVYNFEPDNASAHLEAWMTQFPPGGDGDTWTRADVAEHIRDEDSTFTWLLEPMIERAGFQIADAVYDDVGVMAQYVCTKR